MHVDLRPAKKKPEIGKNNDEHGQNVVSIVSSRDMLLDQLVKQSI